MGRTSRFLFGVAIVAMTGTALFLGHTQMADGRALFAYPMQGQTPEQENIDRAECHDWAVAQTGFDPSGVTIPQSGTGVLAGRAINAQPGPTGSGRFAGSGSPGGALTNRQIERLNEQYEAYLRAAIVCLEGRGYRVSR